MMAMTMMMTMMWRWWCDGDGADADAADDDDYDDDGDSDAVCTTLLSIKCKVCIIIWEMSRLDMTISYSAGQWRSMKHHDT